MKDGEFDMGFVLIRLLWSFIGFMWFFYVKIFCCGFFVEVVFNVL